MLAGAQACWILKMDDIIPQFVPPLFPEVWQKLLSCAFLAGAALAVTTVRQTGTVKSEIFSHAVRCMLIGALLTFHCFEWLHLTSNLSMTLSRRGGPSGWSDLPHVLLAWPIISVFVFGVTAGGMPDPPPSPSPRNAG